MYYPVQPAAPEIRESDFRPSTEQDSPYFGASQRFMNDFARWLHEKYKSGQVKTLSRELSFKINEELSETMRDSRRDLIRRLHESEKEASRIILTD